MSGIEGNCARCLFWLNLLLDKDWLAALCGGTTIVGCHLHKVNRRQRAALTDGRRVEKGDKDGDGSR